MSEVIVLVTGGFDPIHSGHIAYLKDAKKLGDKLIVGVNSDQWLIQKKGSPFLPIEERIEIVSNLSVVDKAIEFTDDELNSAYTTWKTANDYKRKREDSYLSIQDQLDMQYWDSVNGTTIWKDHIAAVKAKYPKPS